MCFELDFGDIVHSLMQLCYHNDVLNMMYNTNYDANNVMHICGFS
jgi:hypothetical protein